MIIKIIREEPKRGPSRKGRKRVAPKRKKVSRKEKVIALQADLAWALFMALVLTVFLIGGLALLAL